MPPLVINATDAIKLKEESSDVAYVARPEQSTAPANLAFALPYMPTGIWLRYHALSIIAISFYNLLRALFSHSGITIKGKTKAADASTQTPEILTVSAERVYDVIVDTKIDSQLPENKSKCPAELEQNEAQIKQPLSKADKKLALKSIYRDIEDDNPADDFIASATSVIKLKVAQASSWVASYYAYYKAKYHQTAFTGLRWELTKNYYSQPQDFSGCELSVIELEQLFKLGVRDFRRVTISDTNAEFRKEIYAGCLFYQAQVKTQNGLSTDIFQNEITDLDLFKLEYQARTGQPVENLEAGILSAQELAQRQQNNSASEQDKLADNAPLTITEMKQVMRSAPSLSSHRCMGNLAHKELTSGQLAYLQSRGVKHFEFIKCQKQNLTGLNLDNQYFDGANFSESNLENNASRNSFYAGAILPENTGFFKTNNKGTEVPHTCNDEFTKVTTQQAIFAVIQAEYAEKVQAVLPHFKASTLKQENVISYCIEIMSSFAKSNSKCSRRFSSLFRENTPRLEAKNYLLNIKCNPSQTTAKQILEKFQAIYDSHAEKNTASRKMPKYLNAMNALLLIAPATSPAARNTASVAA